MVGFEVTPTTAPSRIMFSSFPVSRISRERKSSHTLCPSEDSLCRFESGIGHRPFKVLDHLQSFHITLTTVESCREKGRDEVTRERRAHHLRAEAKHVHVVVLDALVGGIDVV